jgi:hypothetical protein
MRWWSDRNPSIMGMARSTMKDIPILSWLWGEAVVTTMFIFN